MARGLTGVKYIVSEERRDALAERASHARQMG